MVDNKNILNNPNFKKWFGNSKVVDKNGNPLRMYHGTGSDFIKFEHDKTGGVGFYFTSDPEEANVYADFRRGENMNIMPVYLSIQNPATTKIEESIAKEFRGRLGGNPRLYINRILQQRGYDGIIRGTHMIAFYPNQIKSAIGNNGNFDPNDSNILKEVVEEIVKETWLSDYRPQTQFDSQSGSSENIVQSWWLNPRGEKFRVPRQSHSLKAAEILQAYPDTLRAAGRKDPQNILYDMNWVAVRTIVNKGKLTITYNPSMSLTTDQIKSLKAMADEFNYNPDHKIKITSIDDETFRKQIPLEESMFPKEFNRHSLGSCMVAAEMATRYFLSKGIKNFQVVEGWVSLYPGQEKDDWSAHTWIEFSNGRIFDPTKNQWKLLGYDPNKVQIQDNKMSYDPEDYLELCDWEPISWEKFKKSAIKEMKNPQECLLLEKHKRPNGKKARSFVAVFRYKPSLEVLLVKDRKGRWTMPGGQADTEETYNETAWRELEEETNIVPDYIKHWKKIEDEDKITHAYYGEVTDKQKAKPGTDAKGTKWALVDKLDDVKDLKDFHKNIIKDITKEIYDVKKEIKEALRVASENNLSLSTFNNLLLERKRTIDGYLIVMEGIDGSGKSTQCDNLKNWLEDKGWKVTVSKWSNSPDISDAIKAGKKGRWLSPTLFCLLNASDMIWRYENVIKPALDKGHVVICDRFYYTSYVRDMLRGVRQELLDEIYKNFPEPDLILHFIVPPDVAVARLLKDKGFKWYSAGRDIGYSENEEESALKYEKAMDKAYKSILPKIKNYKAIKTTRTIEEIFKEIKDFVREKINAVKKTKFKNMIQESINKLNERMSFADLYDDTDDERIFKSKLPGMRVRPMAISMENGNETWNFGYTSGEKSEWERYREKVGHKGRIIFFKDSVEPDDNAEDLECMVDCDCRDFKYRFAYVDAQQDASMIGPGSLNKALNAAPVKTNPEGETKLCKHLAALVRYLVTNLEIARQRSHLRRRPFNIFEAMDEMANKGSDTTDYYEKDDSLNESVNKVGSSSEEKYSDLPINWDASDIQMLKKWDENTIREFAGLSSSFIAIYRAIIDVNELDYNLGVSVCPEENNYDNYDWSEFGRMKRGFPPILLMREEDGKIKIMDGNHRVYWAQQQGLQTIGAWVVDKLIQKNIDKKNKRSIKETRIITPEESLYEGYITLYHGTTWPLALKAKKGELGPQPLRDLVINVLVNVFHETPSKAAEFYDKHSSIRRNDPAMLFLTTNKKSAESYAKSSTKYGGEILMDVLGQYFWNSPAYRDPKHQKFVQEKLQTDEPAVVTVNVPLEMVLTHPHWITPLRSRLRDIRKNILKNPDLKHILSDDLSMEVFVKEKIPARFVQRIDRVKSSPDSQSEPATSPLQSPQQTEKPLDSVKPL